MYKVSFWLTRGEFGALKFADTCYVMIQLYISILEYFPMNAVQC